MEFCADEVHKGIIFDHVGQPVWEAYKNVHEALVWWDWTSL